jgi:hypothetical protein
MVRVSERKRILTQLNQAIRTEVVMMTVEADMADDEDDDSSEDESDLEQDNMDEEDSILAGIEVKALAHRSVESRWYLRPRTQIIKGPETNDYFLNVMEEKRFKIHFRMKRESFLLLCNRVLGNQIFHNNSHHPQQPVQEQMMVTLSRLGCFGNGASIGRLAAQFRIGEGTVERYTDRCIMAILGLQDEVLCWPNVEARQRSSDSFAEVGFKGCVGLIDGTQIVLSAFPGRDGPDYYNRKGSYAINTLLVCDHDKNIIFADTGWPGCLHDQRLMSNSALALRPGHFSVITSTFWPTQLLPQLRLACRPSRGPGTESSLMNSTISIAIYLV